MRPIIRAASHRNLDGTATDWRCYQFPDGQRWDLFATPACWRLHQVGARLGEHEWLWATADLGDWASAVSAAAANGRGDHFPLPASESLAPKGAVCFGDRRSAPVVELVTMGLGFSSCRLMIPMAVAEMLLADLQAVLKGTALSALPIPGHALTPPARRPDLPQLLQMPRRG